MLKYYRTCIPNNPNAAATEQHSPVECQPSSSVTFGVNIAGMARNYRLSVWLSYSANFSARFGFFPLYFAVFQRFFDDPVFSHFAVFRVF
jgi:hypothetical protein